MMTHERFLTLLDTAAEGTLTPDKAREMREHARECTPCGTMLAAREDCKAFLESCEVPAGFHAAWQQAIAKEAEQMDENKRTTHYSWRKWAAAAAAVVFLVGGTLAFRQTNKADTQNGGMAAKGAAPMTSSTGNMRSMESDAVLLESNAYALTTQSEDMGAAQGESAAQKIIRTASLTLATQNFDADLERVRALTGEAGGRVEYMSLSGDAQSGALRRATLTIRVPSAGLDAFLAGAKGIARVTSAQEQSEDVSENYYDVQTRLATQKAKLERLTALIKTAADLSDLLELESAIADTQYQIDAYEGTQKSYDSRVDESTVTVSLREESAKQASDAKELTLTERLQAGFASSLTAFTGFFRDMLVFIVASAPWLCALALSIVILSIIIKHKNKANKTGEKKGN